MRSKKLEGSGYEACLTIMRRTFERCAAQATGRGGMGGQGISKCMGICNDCDKSELSPVVVFIITLVQTQ